ncbi:hypothetical protein Tco_0169831 [Tanacetum coccineum]
MVACLERTDGNADFHEIVDFLTTSPIHYSLTVSPTIYASYIERFWNTGHSQTVNVVKQIHATVDGKTVVISESSMRSDLHFNDDDGCGLPLYMFDQLCSHLKQIHAIVDGKAVVITESSVRNDLPFDDEDGITCFTNDEIFENLALMGVERAITTDASLVAAQDSDNIIRTQNMAMPNVDIPLGMDTRGSPRRQETIRVLLLRLGKGYHTKRQKTQQKMTKPDTEWKSCEGQSQSKAKDQISQNQSQLNKSTVKTKAVIEEYYWLQSQPI